MCREQRVSGESAILTSLGDVFHLDFYNGSLSYFGFSWSVRSALHFGILVNSAGSAALKDKMEKDAKHNNLVEAEDGAW